MPKPLQLAYLVAVDLCRGDEASSVAVRKFQGYYPPQLPATYEPRPLPGFTPLAELDTERHMPADETELAIEGAAASGDRSALTSLLAATWGDWDRRSRVAHRIANAAVEDESWLQAWEVAEPGSPGVTLVRAERTVLHAWKVRGARRAKYLDEDQIRGFREGIALAEHHMEQAVAAAPEDPTPLQFTMPVAMGRGWSREAFEGLWKEFATRHPHGFHGHLAALQYWCAKWRGSHEQARAFAAAAAANASEGSFLAVLPLIAAFEEHGIEGARAYRTPQVHAAVEACLLEVKTGPDADPDIVFQVRHLLAYFLNRLGRHREAAEQFKAIDGHIGALPWTYCPNPPQEYGWYRRDSVRRSGRR
ncbi:hypothetical protein [Glycomyces paridis]|uniref:DUF4034 domain-containing protein n=1 Tax=Glycomyces paridis TaxID=2126555 RepID=A0A4V4HPU3_9ACTN|nr:hypothetical protein [Glycomyces paridis]THV31296.1 hypothetical protein E9998_02690 [Glycomyces paridis]